MEKLTKNNNYFSQENDVIFHIVDQIKVFKITVVNWALPSLHVIGSLDITLTVHLNGTLNVGTVPPPHSIILSALSFAVPFNLLLIYVFSSKHQLKLIKRVYTIE